MKPASLKLCKELYELSGWEFDEVQGYSLDYLLRKLPAQSSVNMMYTKGAEATYMQKKPWIRVTANTPADALCKLAIALFKEGKLCKEES